MPVVSPFTSGSFLGARVRSFNSNLGWGMGQPSTLTVGLADDPVYGLAFTPPPVGTPVHFGFYGFNFGGLLQKWEEKRDTSGNPVYEAVVTDPREILDGAQVIVGGYGGSVGGVRNLFNAYGFWENIAFGASLANEGGMPWHKVRRALEVMANTPAYGAFGGPLTFRGYAYSLDLSELPTPPSYYRVGGGASAGLLELIAQVCEDGGCDFFVELVGFTIKVRVASRFRQPPLGTISAVANSNLGGTLLRSTSGLELRNELTSAFLVGGDVSQLWLTDAVAQFWGYDIGGLPILGVRTEADFFDPKTHSLLLRVPTELANLNAAPVADVIGSVNYPCTTLEMRLAQVNPESWEAWIKSRRPDVAAVIGLTSPFANMPAAGAAAIRANAVNDERNMAMLAARNAVAGDIHVKVQRLYEFVRGYADEYMGRKFLVALPFLLAKADPETLKVTTSWEVADGGYLPEGSAPLGLSPLNQDTFKTPDGRFRAFCVFSNIAGADLSRVSPNGTVIDAGGLYMEAQVDARIVNAFGPCVVMTLPGPLADEAVDNVGDLRIVAAMLQKKTDDAQKFLKQCPVPLKVAPATRYPAAVAVPLKSNTQTYGPWYASGAPGKVRFDYDPSLTPWNYGGHAQMNLAGSARVLTAVTNMQVGEAGTIERAGAPAIGLGDVLHQDGPNLTGIEVSCGTQGVATSYRFHTFTAPRLAGYARQFVERMKRMSLAGVEMRRALRLAVKDRLAAGAAVGAAMRTARAFMERQAKAKKRETPYDCVMAFSDWDADRNAVRQNVHSLTMEEAVVMSNADDDSAFRHQTAVMSMNGLFRPFMTSPGSGQMPGPSGGPLMPALKAPAVAMGHNAATLNPWKDRNDIEVFTWGDTYQGLHAMRLGGDGRNARVLGLRGPLALVGWGFDINGNCVPGSQYGGANWDDDHLVRQDKWKVGFLDPLFDEQRGIWTVHGNLKGTIPGSGGVPAGGSGQFDVDPINGSGWSMTVWNYFSADVGNGKAIVTYVPTDNRWYITSADCA